MNRNGGDSSLAVICCWEGAKYCAATGIGNRDVLSNIGEVAATGIKTGIHHFNQFGLISTGKAGQCAHFRDDDIASGRGRSCI